MSDPLVPVEKMEKSPAEPAAKGPAAPAKKSGKPKRVLVIDDEEVTRAFIEHVLAGLGYEVVTADTALKGIQSARRRLPDLILLDIMLPEMSGVEALRKLKKNLLTARIPVIMMTSLSDMDMVRQCIAGRCDDYIVKPITKKVLEEKIRKLLSA